jgi:hypothetical protein
MAEQQTNWVQRAGRERIADKAKAIQAAAVAETRKPTWQTNFYAPLVSAVLREVINQTQNGQGVISAAELHMIAECITNSPSGKD